MLPIAFLYCFLNSQEGPMKCYYYSALPFLFPTGSWAHIFAHLLYMKIYYSPTSGGQLLKSSTMEPTWESTRSHTSKYSTNSSKRGFLLWSEIAAFQLCSSSTSKMFPAFIFNLVEGISSSALVLNFPFNVKLSDQRKFVLFVLHKFMYKTIQCALKKNQE